MSKPFNFYGQVTGLIFPEGFPTPFGLFYNNISGVFGVYFPQNIALGAPLHILNEGDLFPTNYFIKQSGSVDREWKDSHRYSLTPSGAMYPAPPYYHNYSFIVSGGISGAPIDKVNFDIPWTGNIDRIFVDTPLLYVIQSGRIDPCMVDKHTFDTIWTGQIINYQTDIQNFSINTSGSLKKVRKDNQHISFSLYSVDFSPGLEEITQNTEDFIGISFGINTISFNRAQ